MLWTHWLKGRGRILAPRHVSTHTHFVMSIQMLNPSQGFYIFALTLWNKNGFEICLKTAI